MRKRVFISFITLFFLTLLFSLRIPGVASAHSLSKAQGAKTGTPTQAVQSSGAIGNTSQTAQDPTWIAQKLAYQVITVKGKDGRKIPKIVTNLRLNTQSVPASGALDMSYADTIWEPSVSGTDATGKAYTNDQYMWDLCGPGASTVSLDYWTNVNDRAFGTYTYKDPSGITTTWNNNHTRGYLTYLAIGVNPPSYSARGETPGEMTWNGPNGSLTTIQDLVDALNWEAANHNTTLSWQSYFYYYISSSNLNLSTLRNDVASDISTAQVAPIALVNDDYLPDWPYIHTSHYVAITGYDNTAGTFTYQETCGSGSCPTTGFGHYTISQQRLLDGINADASNGGGLIW